jgi:AFG3 family protein
MSLSSLSRALARSARSSRQRQGSLLGGHGGLRASSPPLPCGELGFLRSYVTSVIGNRAAVASGAGKGGDWRFLLASRQFRRLFSDKSKKNHGKHSEEENKGKGDESDKSDSKKQSSSGDQWNFEESIKQFKDMIAPLFLFGLLLLSASASSSEQEVCSY